MTAGWIAVMLACAWFAVCHAATAPVTWVLWPRVQQRWATAPARVRVRWVWWWRLLPLTIALATSLAFTAAFLAHEPRSGIEPVGVVLPLAAFAGASLLVAGFVQLAGSCAASAWLAHRWIRRSTPLELAGLQAAAQMVDIDFPLVAVVGIVRPRLLVARSVVESCSPAELAAIVAHERGHLTAADNLKRLCLDAVCDLLSLSRASRDMTACWQEAAEEVADDHATRCGARAIDLAAALVTVARLATGRHAAGSLPASVFYRGGGIEDRVRRLLAHPASAMPSRTDSTAARLAGAAVLAAAATLVVATSSQLIYHGAEWIVRSLP